MKLQSENRISAAELLELQGEAMQLRLVAGDAGLERYINHSRLQKPSLAFAGFTENLRQHRLQIIGKTELHYLATKSADEQQAVVDDVFDMELPAFVVTRGAQPPDCIINAANRTNTPLFISQLSSTPFVTNMTLFLSHHLAPSIYQHGVYIDVFGIGVILLGQSGVGKSEIALELITRGHRLIADDMVELIHEGPDVLVGRSPAALRYHMEIRGVGILNIRDLFGAAALTDTKRVKLVVELIPWKQLYEQEHVLMKKQDIELNGVRLPKAQIPIRPGRSLAVLVEVAARDQLLKQRGIDSSKAFIEALEERIRGGNQESNGDG
ncbi:MAG: HPr(Ser) kinase/phosphatase [Mariprofundaceae bacterium]